MILMADAMKDKMLTCQAKALISFEEVARGKSIFSGHGVPRPDWNTVFENDNSPAIWRLVLAMGNF